MFIIFGQINTIKPNKYCASQLKMFLFSNMKFEHFFLNKNNTKYKHQNENIKKNVFFPFLIASNIVSALVAIHL